MNKRGKHIPSPTHEQIAERAYQIYLANGREAGHAQDNWLQAQYELVHQPIRELVKLDPARPSRVPANLALLAGVVQSALWLAQSSQ